MMVMNSAPFVALGGNMEILETIPIYGPPDWPLITFFIGLGIAIISIAVLRDTKYVGMIAAIIAVIAIFAGIISLIILHESEFDHNEYVVRITNMPAQEFIEKYEVTKHFEYSDVIQVKEIEKK